ncbi:hypothetical protein AO053_04210 [Haemophilus influenzae biotype aegyptius]|uniref:hypothetical protein n=1 Tax=Haemophilus influenzae TaxID=727 RepID=UPI0001F36904|nr:hypothetical protein [Haemophilus influenzae]QEQ61461.1 hypothetical protein F1539_03160 [Haemophilus influenzae biotype aegyptius]QEQ63040.1 hypothetical protein F1538_01775 [Haemophilus influenzae biotype aegyptius]QEQ65020.1 hypothetical protein F1537_02545 [Haemophilus influenzae biotype aegyptius]TMQ38996.1 hypothetical protein AO052_05330 [Haemophilus influenzae biotype aegyptius]TMQ39026.1 hypothetical protein AO053_04210 [Haemophilus influenzae biotype aegyptius]
MKCTIAKHNSLLLQQAIQHYRKSHQIFTFMSLYDDNEPYPIDDVIQVLENRLNVIKRQIDSFTKMTAGLRKNERLETSFYTTKKHLEMMRKRKQEIGD